ncbi:UDP-glucoronosyl and UDP-glucosyl transferase [Dictyocaulus viviparus]|uniref:UDP-glucuronosyltransferase n=1 Tax=Dictyocaulus viviparus TaxID=29172 RepID=A0A0D8XRK1_DICVI|nr:UDP-glucoronosyl and UDP-glucosyl transferase [Dictyocaulus viviparus]
MLLLLYSFLLLLQPLESSKSFKIVLFVPDIANSQVLFNTRVAETLSRAGHDVTMLMISSLDDLKSNDVKIMQNIKVHRINASYGLTKEEINEQEGGYMYQDVSILSSRFRQHMNTVTSLLVNTCQVLEDKEFLEWLQNQHFDLAFAHMYDVCPIGLIHYAKIPSWIWLNSGTLMDFVAHYMGVPKIPSYVSPILMESSDEMNFIERIKSFIGHILSVVIWRRVFPDRETAYFRELIDPSFPDIVDIAKQCPLVMVNSNELYELPRPTLSKIVNIGGLGMEMKDVKPLPDELQRIANDSSGLVVFSFGSVAPSHKMPLTWKNAFLDAFKRFPKYHFIMRYEGTDLFDKLPANVHILKWLPQTDLLAHKKTKAFISHGGYNSVQEAIIAGVPMITIPLFGDQPKNAKVAEKHKFTVNLRKSDINADNIVNALNKLLNDESYSQNVKRLSRMVEKKPVKAEHLLVSWAEFVAEFKTLKNLVPAGNELNFIQYHSLDVIAFLLIIITLIVYISSKFLIYTFNKVYYLAISFKKQKKA